MQFLASLLPLIFATVAWSQQGFPFTNEATQVLRVNYTGGLSLGDADFSATHSSSQLGGNSKRP